MKKYIGKKKYVSCDELARIFTKDYETDISMNDIHRLVDPYCRKHKGSLVKINGEWFYDTATIYNLRCYGENAVEFVKKIKNNKQKNNMKIFENIESEYGVKGKGQPKLIDDASRRKLDMMYKKMMAKSSRFLNSSADYKTWAYCVMDNCPFYFAVNAIKKVRPSDPRDVENTFTAISVIVSKKIVNLGGMEGGDVDISYLTISLSEQGMLRYNTFMSALQAVIDSHNDGMHNDTNPMIVDYVFKLSDKQMRRMTENKNININNMKKKQIVRLTESDLHRVIKESVTKILKENDDFKAHGYKTTSNLGGHEVEISPSGDAARFRFYGGEPTDWLEIEFDGDGVAYVETERGKQRLCDYMRY